MPSPFGYVATLNLTLQNELRSISMTEPMSSTYVTAEILRCLSSSYPSHISHHARQFSYQLLDSPGEIVTAITPPDLKQSLLIHDSSVSINRRMYTWHSVRVADVEEMLGNTRLLHRMTLMALSIESMAPQVLLVISHLTEYT